MTQAIADIRFDTPYFERDIDRTRIGMITRHMFRGQSHFPESFGIHLTQQTQSFRIHETQTLVPRACKLLKGALIAAGGSVISIIEHESEHSYVTYDPLNGEVVGRSKFASSDIDFYVRACNPESRRAIVAEVLCCIMPPVGKVVRTQFALSWEAKLSDVYGDQHPYADGESVFWRFKRPNVKVVKVQIINRTVPHTDNVATDINSIFETYDLECCKWALDDKSLYTTTDALNTLRTRICKIPFNRISDSLVPRMARYYKRCYDFEIEGIILSNSLVHFPDACDEIVSRLRTGKASGDVRQLPLTGYDVVSFCERDNDILFTQMKSYGACGETPFAICARPEEALLSIVYKGLQENASVYWNDWKMKTMNRMCENITWMSCKEDHNILQDACLKSLESWEQVVFALDLTPMFDTAPPFNPRSPEIVERLWICKPVPKPTIYIY